MRIRALQCTLSHLMPKKLQIVVPVFNDWASFVTLLGDLDKACAPLQMGLCTITTRKYNAEIPSVATKGDLMKNRGFGRSPTKILSLRDKWQML